MDVKKQTILGKSIDYPPLSIKDEDKAKLYCNDRYIAKRGTTESIFREFGIGKKLKKIDPDNKYFIYPIDIVTYKDDTVVAIMPYGGITIYEYMIKNRIDEKQFLSMMKHLFSALKLLQDLDILHMDLKADNILIDKGANIRIIDFGHAIFDNHLENIHSFYSSLEEPEKEIHGKFPLFCTSLISFNIKDKYTEREIYVRYDLAYRGWRVDMKADGDENKDLIKHYLQMKYMDLLKLTVKNRHKIDMFRLVSFILIPVYYGDNKDIGKMLKQCMNLDVDKQLCIDDVLKVL